MKFIARKLSNYDLIQEPIQIKLEHVKGMFKHESFREIHSAAQQYPIKNPVLEKLFLGLKTYRESRELNSNEARFRHICTLIEGLIKKNSSDKFKGQELRNRINKFIEFNDTYDKIDDINDLWSNVRNPLSHSNKTIRDLGRDPNLELGKLEEIVVHIFHSIIKAWKYEEFYEDKDIYEIIIEEY